MNPSSSIMSYPSNPNLFNSLSTDNTWKWITVTVTSFTLNYQLSILSVYPTWKLMRFIPPLQTLPPKLFDESPLCTTYTITLCFHWLFCHVTLYHYVSHHWLQFVHVGPGNTNAQCSQSLRMMTFFFFGTSPFENLSSSRTVYNP